MKKSKFIEVNERLAKLCLRKSQYKNRTIITKAIELGKAKAYSSVACFLEHNHIEEE